MTDHEIPEADVRPDEEVETKFRTLADGDQSHRQKQRATRRQDRRLQRGYLSGVDGASDFVVVDGILVVLLIAAYVLTRGWTAWSRR